MFGFLGSPCRSCDPDQSHTAYRGFFCGLSGALRDDYSPAARFLVNRDSTFLSILSASISPAPPSPVLRTCCNPVSTPRPLFSDDLHARYAAAVTICGLSAKLEDDRADETGLRKNAARLLGKAISPFTDRAISFLNTLRFPTADVVAMMEEQSALESRRPNLADAARPTAEAYGMIFSEAARISGARDHQSQLQFLGQNLGSLIYWKDAHDDRLEDARRGRFNPLENAEPGEFQDHFSQAALKFSQITQIPGSFQTTIREILSNTLARHQSLIPADIISQIGTHSQGRKTRKNKGKKEKRSCLDSIDCCPSSGKNSCCDTLCDCGPGDSGCIDCDCCPCH